MPTHYDTLGLAAGAGAEDVRIAYRKLARKLHPDVSKAPDAKEQFQRLQQAYEVLKDPRRKAAYDAILGVVPPESAPRTEAAQSGTTSTPPSGSSNKASQSSPKATEAEARARTARQREKEIREADELRRRAEKRMQDAPAPPKIDLAETRHLTSLLNAGRFVEAERLATRMLLVESRQPVPYAVLGDIARFRGDLDKAVELYGYAAQYEPANPLHQRKYEELLDSRAASPSAASGRYVPEVHLPPLGVAVFAVALAAIYTVFASERPLGLAFAPDWTLGVTVMLFLSGIVVGTCLSLAGALASFGATSGSAMMKVPPALALGLVSIVSFWVACVLYFVVGQTQQAFNRSLSLCLGSVAGVAVVFALAGWARGPALAMENLMWGGNLVYFGVVAGWYVVDNLRTGR